MTIDTHKGHYKFKWLPLGINVAPGIFQQIMGMMLAGLHGFVTYIGDFYENTARKTETGNISETAS